MLKKIFLLQFFSLVCLAQQNLWQSITIANGLSQGMIYDIMQDRQGFIWVATKDGLNRYDGYNFKVFTHNPYKENTISGNTCTALLEDSDGRIWVSTEKDGLNLFDPLTKRFYHAIPPVSTNERSFIIIFIKEDTQGNIWLITDNPDKIFFISKKGYPEKSDFSEWLLKPDALTKGKTQFKFDYHAIGIRYLKDFFVRENLVETPKEEFKVLQDKQKRYWVVGRGKIFCYEGQNKIKVIPFQAGGIPVANQFDDQSIAISNQQYLWVLKPDELLKTDQLTAQNALATMPVLLKGIREIFKDKTGNIWASTYGYGLLKLNNNFKLFHSILPLYSPSHLLETREGKLFMHGNYRPRYRFYEVHAADHTLAQIPVEIPDDTYVQDALFESKKGEYYLIHHTLSNRYLSCYSTKWQLLKQYDITQYGDPFNYSHKFIEDKDGQLWIGLANGNLLKLNPQTGQFQHFSYQQILPKNNSLTETFAFYQDFDNVFWIGTQKGLVKAENLEKQPRYTIYRNSKTNDQSLSNDFVSSIINDPHQPQRYLWVSTKGGGLDRLDKQTGKFEHFTEEQGLPNKVVYGILPDDKHNLWLSTNRGLSRFNPKTLTFTNYNKSDGLQDDEFNTNAYFKGPSGRLFFGGINGISIVNPTAVGDNKHAPVIKLIGLKINNKSIELNTRQSILTLPVEQLNKLEVAHDQNQLSLEFGIMDFTNPVKNRYRYQLIGIDDDWVEAGTNHVANYAQLPSGSYTFKVMGTVNGEAWTKPLILEIKVNPPFYLSWWAYLLYLSVFVYVVYRIYQNQLNRVRLQEQLLYKDKEADRLAELDSLKTRFFANISHEFRTPLTLLSGPLSDFSKKYPNESMFGVMERNLGRLQNLINQMLDLSKLEAGKMNPQMQQGNLAGFVNQLLSSFDSLASNKHISFNYNKSQTQYIAYYDTDKLEKIITNLLSNAFKFTLNDGTIEVKTIYTDKHLTITIKDSGIGIEQERLPFIFDRFYQVEDTTSLKSYIRNYEGTGIGLALVKELTDVLKGKISVESQVGFGTQFTVSIPIDKATWEEFISEESPTVPVNLTESVKTEVAVVNLTHNPEKTAENPVDIEQPVLLIIEDNDDLRAYIRSHFELSYLIVEAVDGQDGYEKAIALIPDLVICDLMMPRMDGFSFCKLVKSDMRTNHIPVIMLTARAALEDRLEGLELGADDYLAKPFNTEELQIRVRNLINIRQALQQKYSQTIIRHEIHSTEPKTSTLDEQFLERLHSIVDKNLLNTDFNISLLADEINMTAGQLRRKLKAITNQNIVEFIRYYKLQKAAKLLENKSVSVSDVAYQVGFESLPYFSKIFFETFGKNPSEWSN